MKNKLINLLENIRSLLAYFAKTENREETLLKIVRLFQETENIFSEADFAEAAGVCGESVNLLHFMQLEHDQHEPAFLEDLLQTVKKLSSAAESMEADMETIDAETKELIVSFISEGSDLLDEGEQLFDALEQECDPEILNTVFRAFHSLKGMAGFLHFDVIKNVTHNAETLLDIFRKQEDIHCQATDIDLLYHTADFLRHLIRQISTQFSDKGFEDDAQLIIERLDNRIQQLSTQPEKPPAEESLVSKEMVERFVSEAIETLDEFEKDLMVLEESSNLEMLQELFRTVHSLKGNAGFVGFTDIEKLCMAIESIFDHFRSSEQLFPAGLVSALLAAADAMQKALGRVAAKQSQLPEIAHYDQLIQNLQKALATEAGTKKLGEILVDMGAATREAVDQALQLQYQTKPTYTASGGTSVQIQRKDIRVDTDKLDRLFDLVGELLTAEVMVTHNPDVAGMDLPNFQKATGMLRKITRELQEITNAIRMMPLEGIFNKMKRLVRDLSRKFQKEIVLDVSGADTEMDKNIIQELSDPLVHILRNAIDHGIENTQERLAKQKDKAGHIGLHASYEGNEILISIEDDGRGLDREKILQKAKEKGLLTSDGDELEDEDVFAFIFEPGFSTAAKISEVSGRGVGMDVVRKNIEKLHGTVKVRSRINKGSIFQLRIPLTLAVMDVMLLRVGQASYALPIEGIKEALRPSEDMITTTMDDQEVVKVRNEIIATFRLHELYGIQADNEKLTEGILVVIESRGKKIALFVDELIGQQQTVVKGLSDYIGEIIGITGSMILHDGSIGLILDIEGIIKHALQNKS